VCCTTTLSDYRFCNGEGAAKGWSVSGRGTHWRFEGDSIPSCFIFR
jgi:hypothetical protein